MRTPKVLVLLIVFLAASPPIRGDGAKEASRLGKALYAATKLAQFDIKGLKNAGEVRKTVKKLGCKDLNYRYHRVKTEQDMLYVVGYRNDNKVVVGRHLRFVLQGERAEFDSISSSSCLSLDHDGDEVALWVTHHLSETPTEFHVFASKTANLPLYVGTTDGMWKVEGAHISRVENGGT